MFNGKTSAVPAFVEYGTTYMPVMNSLKDAGIQSKWDGTNWYLTVSNRSVNLSAIHAGTGKMDIYLNGKLVQKVNGIYAKDPTSGHLTTYMPVWYVMQVLKRASITNSGMERTGCCRLGSNLPYY